MGQGMISVCVLTCNQQPYIRQCMDSVLAQAGDIPLQILVGDDCSDDGTTRIVAEFAAAWPRVVEHIRHNSRLGADANYQFLLKRATGAFIAHLDGDDYWLPGKLKRQMEYMTANPGCAAVYTNALTISEEGDPVGLFNDMGDDVFNLAAMLRRGNFLNTSSMVFRAELREQLLAINGPFLDYRMHLLFARSGFLAQIAEPLSVYRIGSHGSMTSTSSTSNDLVRRLYWEAIMDVPRNLVSDNDFAHGIANFLRRVMSRSLRTRRWELAKAWFPRALNASPYSAFHTIFLVTCSAIRATWLDFFGKMQRGPDGRRLLVRHRR